MTSGFEGLSKPVLYRLSYTGMAPTTGFEPVTNGLTVRCSTAELCRLVPFASGSSPEVRLDLPAYPVTFAGLFCVDSASVPTYRALRCTRCTSGPWYPD